MDIGGTTTDIGEVKDGVVRAESRGRVEGIEVSFPLCDVISVGVGGSSIIKVVDGQIKVGPQSVGSAPGPACFGLGGSEATITDAFLLMGLLDPASFFGGDLNIDIERALAVIAEKVAKPLGISNEAAAAAMEKAWVEKVAVSLNSFTKIKPDTVLAAFGGGGPFVVCKVAEAAGISRVLIPGLAAVFSAFGLGFSDIAHQYEAPLAKADARSLKACVDDLLDQAKRGMYAEGFELADCEIEKTLQITTAKGGDQRKALNGALPAGLPADARLSVSLMSSKRIQQPQLKGKFGGASAKAVSAGKRRVFSGAGWSELPLYRAEDQKAGATAAGPAVLEEAFFTCRIDAGWRFEVNDSGDILLTKV
jgi:N-methylhydantoinase A/oxoprolinase/acetone carboxylase beta subunit